METRTDRPPAAIDFLDPVSGWEAAARWNRAAFDWMAKGWQQWVALVTTVPPHFLSVSAPARQTSGSPARATDEAAHAVAKAEPKRTVRARSGTTPKSRKSGKARTRG